MFVIVLKSYGTCLDLETLHKLCWNYSSQFKILLFPIFEWRKFNFHQISKTVIDIPYEVVVGLRPFAPFMKPKFVPPTKQTWKLLANKNWVQKRTQSHVKWLLRIEHLSSIINKKQHLSYSRGWLACASGHRFLAF